jgi:hypothetical protein
MWLFESFDLHDTCEFARLVGRIRHVPKSQFGNFPQQCVTAAHQFGRYWSKADMRRCGGPTGCAAFDPFRSWPGQFCCGTQRGIPMW